MKKYKLTKQDKELIEVAKKVIKKNYTNNSKISISVGTALKTNSGKIYKGVNIENKTSGPTSICGETSAIAQMVSDGERKINTIVSLWYYKGKWDILPSCGACRHIISQFGNPFIIISKTQKTKLNELYPLAVK